MIFILFLYAGFFPGCAAGDTENPFQSQDSTFRDMLVYEINEYRKQPRKCGSAGNFPAAGPLEWNENLEQAAIVHATDMENNSFFDHRGSDGSRAGQRLTATGYEWKLVGENIGYGQNSPDEILQAWIESPSHCKTMMNDGFTHMGVARVGMNWVLTLAAPQK